MKPFVKILNQNKGVTLVELLTGLAISSIILVIASSVLITGVQVYKKIGIEGQLRDEADYVITRIMDQLYSNSIDDLKIGCDDPTKDPNRCIKLVDDTSIKIDAKIQNDTEVSIINKEGEIAGKEIPIEIKDDHNLYIGTEQINSSKISLEGSEITANCNYKTSIVKKSDGTAIIDKKCDNAIIKINITVKSSDYGSSPLFDPVLHLSSTFGF